MKVILSRKGFDSGYGGYPSPILTNGQMISLPIPYKEDNIRYSDVKADGLKTCYDLMKDLNQTIKPANKRIGIDKETRCHLDPDIYEEAIDRGLNWKPCFGQTGGPQGHLRNQGIAIDDLFLYFGWFRKTVYNYDSKIVFDDLDKVGKHVIFGYLQIGKIIRVGQGDDIPKWMEYHPHANIKRRNERANTIYVARNNLSWNESLPGAGRFMFNDKLVLTKKGLSKSKWDLPDCFRDAKISYHKSPWKDRYFQSADKGQEFVIKDNERIEEWARNKIEGSQIDY